MRTSNERGIAMVTTLLVLMLISAVLVGFTTVVMSDQRYRFIDRDRGQAFYAASGGVEKLTADLGNTFLANVAPTAAQVNAIVAAASIPAIPNVTFTAASAPQVLPGSTLNTNSCTGATSIRTIGVQQGYNLTFCADGAGNPTTIQPPNPIKTGPYEGLIALQTPYQIDVTAKTATGGEVHLSRTIESVAIPVFQFGTFSDVDLSFFAGPNFNFGGRVHTNGNLFLAEGNGATLTLAGKVTAVKEVVRQRLQNGVSIDTAPAHAGTVSMATSAAAFRDLARTEGSVIDMPVANPANPDPSWNEPTWHNMSLSAYNSWIRNGRTGAKVLNLPLITVGGTNPDLIRRPPVGENVANPVLMNERLFTKASIRVLLSDLAADITNTPTVTATPPVDLGTLVATSNWNAAPPNNGTPYGPVDATHPPIARTPGATAAVTVRGAHAANWTQLNVSTPLPAYYKVPVTMTLTKGAANYVLTCTVKTQTQFQQCASVPAIPAGGLTLAAPTPTISTAAGVVNSTTVSAVATAAVPAGATTTVTVASTAAFSPAWFYVQTAAGALAPQILVQCTGYDNSVVATPFFTNCTTNNGAATPALTAGWTVTNNSLAQAQLSTIGGFIKIEQQNAAGVWTDITMQILNYGIGARNKDGVICADPTPNAILRIQRLRDNGGNVAGPPVLGGGCTYAGSTNAADYWPNVLFDPREALQRDVAPADNNPVLGGVMYYIGVDVANLSRWFMATAPFNGGTGAASKKDNGGFTLYFSDRRNNRKADNTESAEYGWEDFVNPASATGAPNGLLDTGEDVNANGALDVYGGVANFNGVAGAAMTGATGALTVANAIPTESLRSGEAQVNRSVLFRHALKLTNGNDIRGTGVTGLTVVSENPVYIEGDWNSFDAGVSDFNGANAATAVIADAVTLLSNNWNDDNSFNNPYDPNQRTRGTPTWYRLAIIGGKGAAFPWPNGTPTDFGTDGGAHNFLRYLEDGDQAVNYLGATATFFYNRQAVGTYKCCTTVYNAPGRNYNFDINFNNPALLPPNTPVFRDMNSVGFSQELRPGR